MRVFTGIKLDESSRVNLISALKEFKKISSPIKWVKPENIHLTLRFLGEMPEDRAALLCRSLSAVNYRSGAFTLRIRGFGKFGRRKDVRILWGGIEALTPLKELYSDLEEQLSKLGFKREERPFSPHLTLGRNKKVFDFRRILDIIEENRSTEIAELKVKAFQVFKSTLTADGPIYSVLKEIHLGKT
jgi:2'-5' RNA ligase